MEQFKEIIDAYFKNHLLFENDKISFDCDCGELIFNKKNTNTITLYAIYICPEYRNKGLCREILYYIIDNCPEQFKYFCIESVISKVLYDYLTRFKYNNKKFNNTKNGFIYLLK